MTKEKISVFRSSKGLAKLLMVAALFISSCSVIEQINQMKQFSQCEFKINTINQLSIAEVSMEGKKRISDFTFAETIRLTTALAKDEIPATFTIRLEAINSNNKKAAMNQLDWKLLIDQQQVAKGIIEKQIVIPPNGRKVDFPVHVSVNLKELLTGKSGEALMNLVADITGQGSGKSELSMKLSPSIRVGNQMLQYPGYVTVKHQVEK